MPLASVLPFLEGALRAMGERRRNASVIKSLRKAENLQCREAAVRCRQRCELAPVINKLLICTTRVCLLRRKI